MWIFYKKLSTYCKQVRVREQKVTLLLPVFIRCARARWWWSALAVGPATTVHFRLRRLAHIWDVGSPFALSEAPSTWMTPTIPGASLHGSRSLAPSLAHSATRSLFHSHNTFRQQHVTWLSVYVSAFLTAQMHVCVEDRGGERVRETERKGERERQKTEICVC